MSDGKGKLGDGRATGGQGETELGRLWSGRWEGLAQSVRLWQEAWGSTEGDTLVLREARSATCKEMSAGGRESRGTHMKIGREREGCRGEEGREGREEASGRAGPGRGTWA